MKRTMLKALALMLFCGLQAAARAEAPTTAGGHDHQPGQGPMHHPDMRGAQAHFHDLMEPLWHSAPGPQRTASACAQAKEIGARIQAMARERGPVKLLGQMAATSKRIAPACGAKQGGKVDEALDALHGQFHQLMGMG